VFMKSYFNKMLDWNKVQVICFFTLSLCCITAQVDAADKNSANVVSIAASSWPPYIYNDKNGSAKGLYIDILSEIFEKKMGLYLEYKELPWKRAQIHVQHGQADLLLTVSTEERLKYTESSRLPVFELYLYAYTYSGHPRIKEINSITSGLDIKKFGLLPVTNLGNSWHKLNIDNLGVMTYYVKEEENAFKVLAHRRADITIEPLYAGNYMINKLNLSSKIVPTKARFGPIFFHLLLSKKSEHIKKMNQINEALERLKSSGRLQEILNKYAVIK